MLMIPTTPTRSARLTVIIRKLSTWPIIASKFAVNSSMLRASTPGTSRLIRLESSLFREGSSPST